MTLRAELDDPTLLINHAWVNGGPVAAAGGATIRVVDPADGAPIGEVPDFDRADTEAAIAAAEAAFGPWRARPAGERCAILEAWHRLILDNVKDLARIMTAEQGKPLAEAEGEIRYAASFVKWFAEEGRRIGGHDIPAPTADRHIMVLKQPIGVCAAITPWNFPAAMITRKCAPAFAAGCTMVVKPSDLTPYTALALGVLATRAGMPAGVFNIVTGMPQDIGAALTGSDVIRKISFTGSTRVGALLMRQSSDTIKRLSLELGGNAPLIIFDDADLDEALAGVMASKFRNAGQTCVCANRILVQSGIHDRFVAALAERVNALRVGNGREAGVDLGPLINADALAKVRRHVDDAVSLGATVVTAQRSADPDRFASPVVLTGVTTDMLVTREETFGPLAPVLKFETEEEAIAIANDTPFGLASYFFTGDLRRAWRVGKALDFGMVGLNTGNLAMEMSPFGGVKQSGLGREGGREGIEEYLEPKAFHWAGLN